MDKAQNSEFAALVKASRLERNHTQRELSDATGISLRSIQRIENGDVIPRAYTVRVLSEYLGLEIEKKSVSPSAVEGGVQNYPRKILMSVGCGLLLIAFALAYVFQSPRFPETAFEVTLYIGALILVYMLLLYRI
jgi:transcriptional regulator with XRE-family HTH domain